MILTTLAYSYFGQPSVFVKTMADKSVKETGVP